MASVKLIVESMNERANFLCGGARQNKSSETSLSARTASGTAMMKISIQKRKADLHEQVRRTLNTDSSVADMWNGGAWNVLFWKLAQ